MWLMLILGLFALLILVYAVLSAGREEDEIMEDLYLKWSTGRGVEDEDGIRKMDK